ncbi:MAG: hypothetical protein QXM75_03930 [Candidatus Diapherotrites archaeon]
MTAKRTRIATRTQGKYGKYARIAASQLLEAKKAGIHIKYCYAWPKNPKASIYRALGRKNFPLKMALSLLLSQDAALRYIVSSILTCLDQSFLKKHVPKALSMFPPEQRLLIRKQLALVPLKKEVFEKLEASETKIYPKILTERRYLLTRKKPYVATPYAHYLFAIANKLSGIDWFLRKEFPGSYIGAVVRGSMAKGYLHDFSDIDVVFIGTDPAIEKIAINLCKSARIPLDESPHFLDITKISPNERPYLLAYLFTGIFFGEKATLQRIQRDIFLSMSKEEWELLRKEVARIEIASMEKAFARFGIKSPAEKRRIIASVGQRVPPEYEEMRKILKV